MAENIGQDIQGEVLNAIRKSQAVVVDTVERWTTTVQALTPELPGLNLPFAESLNIAGKLPKPEDMVKSAYDLAEQLLASQRKFAEDLLAATAPLLPGGTSTPAANGTSTPAANGTSTAK